MRTRRFAQVDVFTSIALRGNPVAVVLDGEGLDVGQMQAFTQWTNLSEATFVSPPTVDGADYAVRIFAQDGELPFAGHPTLGTAHAWLAAGGAGSGDRVVQQCGVGLVTVRRDGQQLAFAAPPLRNNDPLTDEELADAVESLGVSEADVVAHAWCDNGPHWQALVLRSAEAVLAVRPPRPLRDDQWYGVVGPHPAGSEAAFEVRALMPGPLGNVEDPVTGSLNAALGQWLIGSGQAPDRYIAAQGTALGRAGRVHVEKVGDEVWVGGGCTTVIQGTVAL